MILYISDFLVKNKKVKRNSHLAYLPKNIKKPTIEIVDMPLSKKYYRVTEIKLDNKEKYYVYWHNQDDFKRGFNRLKRHESTTFTNEQIKAVNTTTHRYKSQRFIAKGFIP